MFKERLKSYDYSLLVVYLLITIFGVIMVYSASMVTAVQVYGYASNHFFTRQLLFFVGSLFILLFVAIFPYKKFSAKGWMMFFVFGSLIVLTILLLAGNNVNNATSWFSIGPISIQPAEFVKLAVIIYMAAVYAKKQPYINDFNTGVIPPILFLVIICFLIFLQPDIGTAGIIFVTGTILVFCSGMNWKNLFRLFITGIIAIVVCSPILIFEGDSIFTEERIGRLTSFIDPFLYVQDQGMQLVNSYLAIGSGGLTGVGLGKSIQKLGYLPEAHTDFIMAIIAEELGLFGVGFVLFCLCYIVLKGIYIGLKCKDAFGSLLAFGISGIIGVQAFINLGGVSGIIPITGVTLPFISYGGSSLLVLSISMGILLNISSYANLEYTKSKKKDKNEKPIKKRQILHTY